MVLHVIRACASDLRSCIYLAETLRNTEIFTFLFYFQCSATCGKGVREIKVVCLKTTKTNMKDPVKETECTGEKPPTMASCDTGIPCNDPASTAAYSSDFII